MHRPRDRLDEAFADPGEMIGVDREAHAAGPRGSDELRGDAPEALCEEHRGAPMEEAKGLACSLIDGHRRSDKVFTQLNELDPEMADRAALAHLIEELNRGSLTPDRALLYISSLVTHSLAPLSWVDSGPAPERLCVCSAAPELVGA